jgi:hypothetical protein
LAKLGRDTAERICVVESETDPETVDDIVWKPEGYARQYYPYTVHLLADDGTEERFEIFKAAFVGWIRDTFDEDKIPECNP